MRSASAFLSPSQLPYSHHLHRRWLHWRRARRVLREHRPRHVFFRHRVGLVLRQRRVLSGRNLFQAPLLRFRVCKLLASEHHVGLHWSQQHLVPSRRTRSRYPRTHLLLHLCAIPYLIRAGLCRPCDATSRRTRGT